MACATIQHVRVTLAFLGLTVQCLTALTTAPCMAHARLMERVPVIPHGMERTVRYRI
jgi:hypothetical protein